MPSLTQRAETDQSTWRYIVSPFTSINPLFYLVDVKHSIATSQLLYNNHKLGIRKTVQVKYNFLKKLKTTVQVGKFVPNQRQSTVQVEKFILDPGYSMVQFGKIVPNPPTTHLYQLYTQNSLEVVHPS